MSSRHLETERTYELPDGAPVPDLVTATDGVVASVDDVGTVTLDATYVDTDELSLLARRITLRRRSGGDDEGWHLKLPARGDTRHEVHWPLREGTEVPEKVQQAVTAFVLGRPLRPVVSLVTTRHRSLLSAADGTVLAELCDDSVAATVLLDRPSASRGPAARSVAVWREVEVELVEGDPGVLDVVHDALVGGGARRSPHPSKLARSLAEHVMPPPRQRIDPGSASAGAVLLDYVGHQLARLRDADLSWRLDEDGDGVHDLRVQARRLRTALQVYRPVFHEETARRLADGLTGLGRALSGQRDLQVRHEQLHRLLARVDDRVAGSVDPLTQRDRADADAAATAETQGFLESPGYVELLTDLEALASGAGLSEAADEAATAMLPGLVGRAHSRLRRRAQRVDGAAPDDRVERWHDLRKAAKRLRYACEVAEPALGKETRRRRKRATRVQRALGDHHDAHVLAAWLERLSRSDDVDGRAGFTLGRLHAERLSAAHEAERKAARAMRRVR